MMNSNKKTKKLRILSMLLMLCMVVSLLPVTAFAADTLTSITAVEITGVPKPTAGVVSSTDGITVTTTPADAVTVVEKSWWDDTTNTKLGSTDEFIDGHQYYISVTLGPKTGFKFDFGSDSLHVYSGATVNGEAPDETRNLSGKLLIYGKNMATTQPVITQVEITGVSTPMAGDPCSTDDITITTTPADAATVLYIAWFDQTRGYYMNSSDYFTYGNMYSVIVKLKPKEGYAFEFDSSSTADNKPYTGTVTFDGTEADMAEELAESKTSLYIRSKIILPDTLLSVISSADVSGIDLPVVGQTPDYEVTLPADANYRLATKEEVSKFADESYVNALKNGVVWTGDNTPISPDSVFSRGKNYQVYVILASKDGYIFSEPLNGTINGNPELFSQRYSGVFANYFVLTSVQCKATVGDETAITPINAVDVSAISLPVVGETPDYEGVLPEGAPYHFATKEELEEFGFEESIIAAAKNGIFWNNDGGYMEFDDGFEESSDYYVDVVLVANDGFDFAELDDMEYVTLDGKSTFVDMDNSESRGAYFVLESDYLDFDIPDSISIKSVDAFRLALPVAGQKPDYDVTLPAGVNYRLATKEEMSEVASKIFVDASNNGIVWLEITPENEFGVPMSPEAEFVEGKEYRVGIFLVPNDEYKFLRLTSGTINHKSELFCEEDSYIDSSIFALTSVPFEATAAVAAVNPFTDVPEGSYYKDAVLWAVEKEITNGMTPATFGPNEGCTRAQAVTFLWRSAGSPRPTSTVNPFSDVKEGSYYYDAVLWAVEKGITKGTTATKFSPNEGCTRAQIVTFLWRTSGSPSVGSTVNPFKDVSASAYYEKAVLWAVSNEITNGTAPTTFSSNSSCTRAQIVTFLYRNDGN